jgi:hypothetical protein
MVTAAKNTTAPSKAPSELTLEELQELLKNKKDEEVPTLKEELNDLMVQVKEKIARLKKLEVSVSLMSLAMNITDEEKTKVRDTLVKMGKPMSKSELARGAGFANEKGAASAKFGEVLKAMVDEDTINIEEVGNKHMVKLA